MSERGCAEITKLESIKLNFCDLGSDILMKIEIKLECKDGDT